MTAEAACCDRRSGGAEAAVWLVGLGRVELPTSHLSGARSNQLSYRPEGSSQAPDRGTTLGLSKPNSTRKMSWDSITGRLSPD